MNTNVTIVILAALSGKFSLELVRLIIADRAADRKHEASENDKNRAAAQAAITENGEQES